MKALELMIDSGFSVEFEKDETHWQINSYLDTDMEEKITSHFHKFGISVEFENRSFKIKKHEPSKPAQLQPTEGHQCPSVVDKKFEPNHQES
jgi:hypothetical protein